MERYKDHVIPVKAVRDIYVADKRRRPAAKAAPDTESTEEIEDVAEDAVVDEQTTSRPISNRGTAFVNHAGEHKEKIEIGTRQFVRFPDILPLTPTKGTFDVNNIRDSAYFFS